MRARIASLSTPSRRGRHSKHNADRDPSSSPSPERPGPKDKHSGNTTNDDSDDGEESFDQSYHDTDNNLGKRVATQGENKRENRDRLRKDREAKARRMFNSLPPDQQEYIWNILVSRVADVVESHPLASSVSLHLKQETVLDASLQVREVVASLLVLPLNELNVGRGKNDPDRAIISMDALHSLVTRVLSSTPGLKNV